LFLAALPAPASAGAALRTVRVAIPGQPYVVAFQVAKAKGYYQQENLDVELAAMGSALFSAILGGMPVKIVMSSFRRPLFLVYGKPEIRDLAQLKGKKIGVPAIGAAGHSMLVEVLRRHGYDPGRDFSMLGLGLTQTLLQALTAGVV